MNNYKHTFDSPYIFLLILVNLDEELIWELSSRYFLFQIIYKNVKINIAKHFKE